MHRAYNVDSTTYAYVRVATYWGLMPLLSYVTRQHTLTCELRLLRCKRERVLKCLATYAYVRVATCGRTATCCTCLTGNIRLRANCDADCRRQCGWRSWQHTLTCELRRELRGAVPDVMPHWQHTLTCELRPVARTNYNTCPLATYAYVRVATIVGQGHTVYGTGNIRLRASCDLISVVVGALDESLATYAYVRVATPRGGALAGYHGWQHTLTCELRLGRHFDFDFCEAGNIRLRASCDP